jgi:dihydrofolate synthase/folylpolyglutamate synthase
MPPPMTRKTLHDWLSWQESLHLSAIDLGLDRIRIVAERLHLLSPSFKIITVAGTNGKGSTVAMLDSILRADGYITGVYTSPHIIHYNERIQVNGSQASDERICQAFAEIEQARDDVSLTYFEFGTLAAMLIFQQQGVDVAVLEVGLGGRLDAANLWDADVAVITSIGIDHVAWLGNDREKIGFEKAGIMRADRPVVCGDPDPPASIAEHAKAINAHLFQYGEHYLWQKSEKHWNWQHEDRSYSQLPLPSLQGDIQLQNAATVLAALAVSDLAITETGIRQGLQTAVLMGRLQKVQDEPEVLLDVAHNAHAAKELGIYLRNHKKQGKTRAVFSILADKNIEDLIPYLADVVDEWYVSTLNDPRAMSKDSIVQALQKMECTVSGSYNTIDKAMDQALKQSWAKDRVVIFGSFLVISEVISNF